MTVEDAARVCVAHERGDTGGIEQHAVGRLRAHAIDAEQRAPRILQRDFANSRDVATQLAQQKTHK